MMSIATCIDRVGALAVTLGVGLAVAGAPGVAMGEAGDPTDTTALIMCGTTCPTPNDFWLDRIMSQFVLPTHPDQNITPVKVTAPMEFWPITGLFRLVGLAVGPQSLWGPGGPGWPDEPLWKLSGLFDLTADKSLAGGVAALEDAMADNASDHLVIYGNSQGAGIANVEKRKLAEQYPGPDAPDIDFVLGGDPNLPNGGLVSRFPGFYIPIVDLTFNGPAPTDTQFDTVEINRQYDGFSDFPLYPLNVVADLNALLGIVYVHMYGLDVSLPAEHPTESPAYQYKHGDTDYYFFENQHLPLFGPLRTLGVPESWINVVEPFFKVIVELGYDRTIPAWEPTPARLVPQLDPAKVIIDLVKAVGEGINNAAALFGLPAALTGRTPARVAALGPVDAEPKAANTGIAGAVPVSAPAPQPSSSTLTAPAGADLPAPKASMAQQNPPATFTGLGLQTTPTVSTKTTAQSNPARFVSRAPEGDSVASTPTADNTSEVAVNPKPMPSATTLTLKATKPVRPAAAQRPVGKATRDVSAPRKGDGTTAGSDSDAAPKAGSTGDSSPGGANS
ncbi:MAG: hypothetical protein QOH57_3717 [Mycobacterium sp.]|nr:hypothetical protein [Mycobacterium sp.]